MDSGARVDTSARRKAVWGTGICIALLLAVAMATAGCGQMTREGTASSYLIITRLDGSSGAEPDEFDSTLRSDVETVVDEVPSVFNDLGRVSFILGLKDPGSSTQPTEPTSANFITLRQYHVRYIRADRQDGGTPGVDVPYGFDGALTLTVRDSEVTGSFELVRHIAKLEAPLLALVRNGVILSTIAEITFFGFDQTGREVSVTARMLIDFGNFADPE
jgi:hypothetical protein